MFEILLKYQCGQFAFSPQDNLALKCNIPYGINGVYIVYTTINNHKMVIYIGCSGMYNKETGEIITRSGGKGMSERIKAKQFGKPRQKSWPEQMQKENFEELIIEWYDTKEDIPEIIEHFLLFKFKEEFNRLPLWNVTQKLKPILKNKFEIFMKENEIK